jgi:hypothetical protein
MERTTLNRALTPLERSGLARLRDAAVTSASSGRCVGNRHRKSCDAG